MKSRKDILLVEDNANDAELMMAALRMHDLAERVALVRDGAEALDYLYCRGAYSARQSVPPVVVLLDIKMPRLDGTHVLRRIRADDRTRGIPVVMLTSSREESDLKRCYELGANAYVVKPVDFKHFAETVRQLGVFWALINEPPPAAPQAPPPAPTTPPAAPS